MTEENYGTEVSIEELKGHYETKFMTSDQFIDLVKEWHKSKVKKLTIPVASNCTTFNNRKFIRAVFDGTSTAVTQYQVVDELGQFWFQGTKEDCEQFLYSC